MVLIKVSLHNYMRVKLRVSWVGKTVMNRVFKAIVVVLVVATFIQAIALAYVLGFEYGVKSRQPIIQRLCRELNPDLMVDFFTWLHPLRNTLFGTSMILALCWASVLLSIMQRKLCKPKNLNTSAPVIECSFTSLLTVPSWNEGQLHVFFHSLYLRFLCILFKSLLLLLSFFWDLFKDKLNSTHLVQHMLFALNT